jgi:hypothetical protein
MVRNKIEHNVCDECILLVLKMFLIIGEGRGGGGGEGGGLILDTVYVAYWSCIHVLV